MSNQRTSGPYQEDRKQIQESIYYMASRLRVASLNILATNKDKQRWMYPMLLTELNFALSFIGMSAAIGQSCDIPILLRILASQLYQSTKQFTLPMDRDFLLGLDAGNDPDDMSAAVESYHLPWWTYNKKPENDCELSLSTFDAALNYHRSITANKRLLPIQVNKEKYTWPRQVTYNPRGLLMDCDNCRLYRGVSLGVLDNIQDLRHQVHGLEVSSENNSDMAERRAAGFFQLYEAALMKELDDSRIEEVTGKGKRKVSGNKKHRAAALEKSSAAELKRLQNLPSLKWTWGSDLTVEDVLNLARIQLPSRAPENSGYNISLPWGRQAAASSGPPSLSSSTSPIHSDIADDNIDIPLLNVNDIPTHFSIQPLRNLTDDPHPLSMGPEGINLTVPTRPVYSWLEPTPDNFFSSPPDVIHSVLSDASTHSNESVPAGNVYSDKSSDDDLDITGTAAAMMIIDEEQSDQATDSNESKAAGDVYSAGSSSVNIPIIAAASTLSSSNIERAAYADDIRDDNTSLSSFGRQNPYMIFSSSDTFDDDIAARDIFTSSDIDDNIEAAAVYSDDIDDNIEAAAVYSDDDDLNIQAEDVYSDEEIEGALGGRMLGAMLSDRLTIDNSAPTTSGPFTPQYFSTIPIDWLPVKSDEQGNICYDSDDD